MFSAQFIDENVNDEIESMEYDEVFNKELEKEIKYDNDIDSIIFYKEKLEKHPDFIGIKNICSGEILNIIKESQLVNKGNYGNFDDDIYDIFYKMCDELEISLNKEKVNYVINKIFKRIYVGVD